MKLRRRPAFVPAISISLCLLSSLAYAEGVSIDAASRTQISDATDHYERGVVAFDAAKFSDALSEFQQSNDIISSPNSRMMIGRTLVKLGRLPEAHRELSEAIEQAGGAESPQRRYKKTVETAQSELKDIKDKLAYVTLRFAESAAVQGRPIAVSRFHEPQVASPGSVVVEATFGDGQRVTKELNMKPGERSAITLQPPPQKPVSAPAPPANMIATEVAPNRTVAPGVSKKTLGYVAGAVGVVGIGTFVGFGLVAASSYGDTKSECRQQVCPEAAVDNQGSKSLFQGIGYTGLGIGVVGLATGALLLLSAGSNSTPRTALHVGPLSANVTGSF